MKFEDKAENQIRINNNVTGHTLIRDLIFGFIPLRQQNGTQTELHHNQMR